MKLTDEQKQLYLDNVVRYGKSTTYITQSDDFKRVAIHAPEAGATTHMLTSVFLETISKFK